MSQDAGWEHAPRLDIMGLAAEAGISPNDLDNPRLAPIIHDAATAQHRDAADLEFLTSADTSALMDAMRYGSRPLDPGSTDHTVITELQADISATPRDFLDAIDGNNQGSDQ
ncbi:MAG TPA: hypothetical protein VMB52_05960 [Verrucomicrobiae bacterium]|nr:hypothetical protein [Verrucomicrobiae bacterium]